VEGPHGEDEDTVQHVRKGVWRKIDSFTVTRACEYTRSNSVGYNKQQHRCYYFTVMKEKTSEGL
jgi:hypothetical protein